MANGLGLSELYRRVTALEDQMNVTVQSLAVHQATCMELGRAASESRATMAKTLDVMNTKLDLLTDAFHEQRGALKFGKWLYAGITAVAAFGVWAASHLVVR